MRFKNLFAPNKPTIMDAIANYSSSETDESPRSAPDPPQPGKVRQFPHVDGQYATSVFLKVPPSPQLGTYLTSLSPNPSTTSWNASDPSNPTPSTPSTPSTSSPNRAPNDPQLTPVPAEELHLSLSRTVPIVDAQRHSLLAELHKAIQKVAKKNRITTSLDIRIGPESALLTNDDASRTFLVLDAHDAVVAKTAPSATNASIAPFTRPRNTLHDLVDATTAVFTRHGLPGYYPEKRMHVSIAWCLGDQRDNTTLQNIVPTAAYTVPVDAVTCRIGKKDFDIPLHC